MITVDKKLIEHNEFHIPFYKQRREKNSCMLVEKFNSNIKDGLIEFEDADCLCGHNQFYLLTSVDKHSVLHKTVMCQRCGLLQTNPHYSHDALRDFLESNIYKNLYYGGSYENYAYEKYNIFTGMYIYEDLKKFININQDTKVLEIGSAAGWNLLPFIDKKAKVLGIDYNNRFVEIGKSIGINLEHKTVYELEEKFDIIIINKMFSIILEPLNVLKKVKELLNPNGLLYLNVLSNERFDFNRIHNIRLYYFTIHSLNYFVSHCEFVRIRYGRHNKDYSFHIFKHGNKPQASDKFFRQNLRRSMRSIRYFNLKYKLKLFFDS